MVWLIISELLESLTMSPRSGATLVIKGGKAFKQQSWKSGSHPKTRPGFFTRTEGWTYSNTRARARTEQKQRLITPPPLTPKHTKLALAGARAHTARARYSPPSWSPPPSQTPSPSAGHSQAPAPAPARCRRPAGR